MGVTPSMFLGDYTKYFFSLTLLNIKLYYGVVNIYQLYAIWFYVCDLYNLITCPICLDHVVRVLNVKWNI